MTVELIFGGKTIILTNNVEILIFLLRDFKFKFSDFISNKYKCYSLYPRYRGDTQYYLECKFLDAETKMRSRL